MAQGIEAGVRLIQCLASAGVEYVFTTFGTDHPTLIKGLARADSPSAVLAPDETLAASAAHGYAQVTGQPQAVLAHVDVGTANLGPSLHNTARSQVPMVVLAGRTPHTTRGERPGSRSIFVHWYQDVYDQHSLVREYANWTYELETGANVDRVVARALDMTHHPSPGPTYLTLPREVLREPAEPATDIEFDQPAPPNPTLTRESRTETISALTDAEFPVLVTSYFGRNDRAVDTLVDFAETTGIGVIEAAPAFTMNFPRDHRCHLGYAAEPWLESTDLVILTACEVPWVPSQTGSLEDTPIIQIDRDPAKTQYPLWDFRPDIAIQADPVTAIADVTSAYPAERPPTERLAQQEERHTDQRTNWVQARETDSPRITPASLSAAIADAIPPDAIVVDETVTNTVSVLRHLERTHPGTYYSYCSSGLGWALGASIGIKLARPDRLLVTVVGDGSFLFGNPLAAIEMIHACDLPHLWVVYNNEGWQAVADAVADQYDDTDFLDEAFVRFPAPPDYASALSGLGCFGERLTDPEDLDTALTEAIAAVRNGTHAVLDVAVTTEDSRSTG